MEFTRSQVDSSRKTPEILDVNTLLALDSADLTTFTEVQKREKNFRDLERKPNNLICHRCYNLKHLHKLLDYNSPANPEVPGTPKPLAHYVHTMDREKILKSVLEKIYFKSIVIKVIDMANFEGSQIPEIYENVNLKKHKLIIVCNKIDALPKGFSVDRL